MERGDNTITNKKTSTILFVIFLTLLVVSATVGLSKAVISLLVTPMSGAPGDVVAVRSELSGEFEAQSTVGIGFGAEVKVINEAVTVEGNIGHLEGTTANRTIKPGSFRWAYTVGGSPFEIYDNGDGTLGSITGFITSSVINYTSGFFSRTTSSTGDFIIAGHKVNYTTYENDVTPEAGATVSGSGVLITTITVPPVPNGTYTITAFDEVGNIGTVNFQVVGSDIIPEPLTVGAIVLLSSTAMLVSFYWTRKRSYTKNIK